MLRTLGMVALACTGIGAIYMISRIKFIRPGKVGVVTDYWSGENEVLEPGYHCIVSPLRSFVQEIPGPDNIVLASEALNLHTADNIEIRTKINIQYTVKDAKVATTKINGTYQEALFKATENVLSQIIMQDAYTLQRLSSAAPLQPDRDKREEVGDDEKKRDHSSVLGRLSATLLEKIKKICAPWSIEIDSIQLVNVQATNRNIESQIEAASRTQFEANSRLVAARTEQESKRIDADTQAIVMKKLAAAKADAVEQEAEGYAKALAIRTKAQKDRIDTLAGEEMKISPETVLVLDTQIQTAEALAKAQNTLFLGSGMPSALGLMSMSGRNVGMPNANENGGQVLLQQQRPA